MSNDEYLAWIASGAGSGIPFTNWTISRRQFYQQAALAGIITKQEAKAAITTGTIPAMLQTIVDALPDENQQFDAEMKLIGAFTFERQDPLVAVVGVTLNLTEQQINDFFTAASLL